MEADFLYNMGWKRDVVGNPWWVTMMDDTGMNEGCGEQSLTRLEDTGMNDAQFCCFASLVTQQEEKRYVDENEGNTQLKIDLNNNKIELKAKICLERLRVNPQGGKFFTHSCFQCVFFYTLRFTPQRLQVA